jgi:DNA-3-methyladenine glycosylase II
MPFAAQHIRAARLHLQKADPVMKQILKQVGPFTAKTRRDRFFTLVQSIVSQQISGAAAKTILQRLSQAVSEDGITPDSMAEFNIDELRVIGVSRQKATYILDLADAVQSGRVDLKKIGRKSDDEVVGELIQVKGIGVWTAQMFMMFSLARMDIFPDGDLGIQNAIKNSYRFRGELTKTKMEKIAEPWRPYATIASWYLWRSLEVE